MFAFVDRSSTDENGPAFFMLFGYVVDDGLPLVIGRAEDHRGQLLPNRRPVRRHRNDAASIYLVQLAGAGRGGAGHAGQPLVAKKEILYRDAGGLIGRERDLYTFFGFDRLVDARAP